MQHEVPRSFPYLVIGQSKGVRARVVKVNFGIEDLTDRLGHGVSEQFKKDGSQQSLLLTILYPALYGSDEQQKL